MTLNDNYYYNDTQRNVMSKLLQLSGLCMHSRTIDCCKWLGYKTYTNEHVISRKIRSLDCYACYQRAHGMIPEVCMITGVFILCQSYGKDDYNAFQRFREALIISMRAELTSWGLLFCLLYELHSSKQCTSTNTRWLCGTSDYNVWMKPAIPAPGAFISWHNWVHSLCGIPHGLHTYSVRESNDRYRRRCPYTLYPYMHAFCLHPCDWFYQDRDTL